MTAPPIQETPGLNLDYEPFKRQVVDLWNKARITTTKPSLATMTLGRPLLGVETEGAGKYTLYLKFTAAIIISITSDGVALTTGSIIT